MKTNDVLTLIFLCAVRVFIAGEFSIIFIVKRAINSVILFYIKMNSDETTRNPIIIFSNFTDLPALFSLTASYFA